MESHVTLSLKEYENLKKAASFRAEAVNAAVKARLDQEVYVKMQPLRSEIYKLQAEKVELAGDRLYNHNYRETLERQLECMRKRGLFSRIFNLWC